jgi:lipid A 3-O-deacylase
MLKTRYLLLPAAALLAFHCAAADLRPGGVFVQLGQGDLSTQAASVGLIWPWAWQHAAGSGQFGGYTEAYVSRWRAKDVAGRANFDQVGLVPMFRFRPDAGRSPWFAEAGIGLTYMDRLFSTHDKQFSTRFNFADVVGLGRSFGEGNRHELTLRLTHFSNGGIKHPNPGENIIGLRYAYLF